MTTTTTTIAKKSGGHRSGAASEHLAKVKRAQKSAQRSQQKKQSKLSKYGRTEQSLQNHHLRKQLKLERESKWQHEGDDVMRSLMERISSAAHGRMRPNMANFDGAPMDKSELKQIIRVELGTTLSKVELDRIFQTFDHDLSGRINYREVIQHLYSDLGNKESRAYLTLYV